MPTYYRPQILLKLPKGLKALPE